MLERITGPPILRPHQRQRRLNMPNVRASHIRHQETKARQRRNDELSFALLELDAIRQRRGDENLDHLGNLVAAFLCPDWRPPLTLANEPDSRIPGRANETKK